MNCETCRFFQAQGKFGMCQRYPEYVMKQAGMWCGEYQKRPEAIVDDRPTQEVAQESSLEPQKRRGRPPKNDQTLA